MPKISGLIFSADPIKETLATAKHLLEFTDEVVVLYAGTTSQYKKFANSIHDSRIKPHYGLKIGYPEPFRHYGIGFCKYDLIAMLDVDERFSSTATAKKLLNSREADIYKLWRHEITSKSSSNAIKTRQYRLFSKGSLAWRGMLHETPRILGKVADVPDRELNIIHNTGNSINYNKLNMVFPTERPASMAVREGYVGGAFENLGFMGTLKRTLDRYSEHKRNFSMLPHDNTEIIKELRKYGIMTYLGLDQKQGAERTISRYSSSKTQGIDLLIKMIFDRYAENKHAKKSIGRNK